MISISKPLKLIWDLIGSQEIDDSAQYRPIVYHKMAGTGGEYLLYNSFTREIVLLSPDEWEGFSSGAGTEYLIKHWFLVPREMDEATLLYSYRHMFQRKHPRKTYGKLNLCTIATTTDCNARCPYCYEAGIERRHMSKETALDVAKFIIPRASENLTLSWFGGEPLFNSSAIDAICEQLQFQKVPFKSTMVTNGYLLKDIPEDKIKGLWNLKRAQITLDGLNETYKRVKSYVDNPKDPFLTVTNNIEMLLSYEIFVNIRLNLSADNVDEMALLVDWLSDRYPDKKNLNVYSRVLFDIPKDNKKILTEKHIDLQNKIRDLGLCKRVMAPPGIRRCHCMADDGRSVVINPDGDLSLCEHYLDSESYGSIYGGPNSKETLSRFLKRQEPIPECKTCFYRPQCTRLKMCQPEGLCDEENRMIVGHQTETMMMDVYRRWKNENVQLHAGTD